MLKEGFRRVSTVLTPFTGIEFVDRDLLEPAAEKGTRVHEIIQGVIENEMIQPIVEDELQGYIDSFFRFWDDSHHSFDKMRRIIENRFYDDDLMYTGAIDLIMSNDEKTYLIDWKTSSKKQKSWALQGAAYRNLIEKNGYKNVVVLFVHLKKNGKPSVYKYEDYQKDWDIFKKCLELYNYFDMHKTRSQYGN